MKHYWKYHEKKGRLQKKEKIQIKKSKRFIYIFISLWVVIFPLVSKN